MTDSVLVAGAFLGCDGYDDCWWDVWGALLSQLRDVYHSSVCFLDGGFSRLSHKAAACVVFSFPQKK